MIVRHILSINQNSSKCFRSSWGEKPGKNNKTEQMDEKVNKIAVQ